MDNIQAASGGVPPSRNSASEGATGESAQLENGAGTLMENSFLEMPGKGKEYFLTL